MKFGKVENPEQIDFTIPPDPQGTIEVLKRSSPVEKANIYVGCAKWNRQDLANFYPRGIKDELEYYATQFNSIELNATFYNNYGPAQIEKWRDKTPGHFKFFPKVPQMISHLRRLNNVTSITEEFCDNITAFDSKLGMAFLQLHDNFGPKNFDRLVTFVEQFPKAIPLAIELRNTAWYNNDAISGALFDLLEKHQITNILTDTAGRRDLMHMRLTTPYAFIRWVGSNHESDYGRLEDWVERVDTWIGHGLRELYFFVHQNHEKESPLLAAHLIHRLNKRLDCNIKVPASRDSSDTLTLNF